MPLEVRRSLCRIPFELHCKSIRPSARRPSNCRTLTLTGRGERMRASGPVQRAVGQPQSTDHLHYPSAGGILSGNHQSTIVCEYTFPRSSTIRTVHVNGDSKNLDPPWGRRVVGSTVTESRASFTNCRVELDRRTRSGNQRT